MGSGLADYYAILGVPRYSDSNAVRSAYMAQIKFFHPDIFTENPEVARLKTQQLNEAYSVLKDPAKKENYDHLLRGMEDAERIRRNAASAATAQPKTPPPNQKSTPGKEKSSSSKNWIIAVFVLLIFLAALGGNNHGSAPSHSAPMPTPSFQLSEIPEVPFAPASTMEPAVVSTVPLPRPSVAPPPNGYIFYDNGEDRVAPFTVETQGYGDFYVKLRELYTKDAVLIFYVRGGSSVDIDVPLGNYELLYATGSSWYGESELFGDNTVYSKADDWFDFYEEDGYVNGWTVKLYLQANGNLDIESISADEF